MRVLQLHNRQAGTGGADMVVDAEAGVLRRAGHDVEQSFVPAAHTIERSSVGLAVDAVWNRSVYAEVGARIAEFHPDVVHVHTPFPTASPAVFRAATRAGCATVTTSHSFRYSCVVGTCLRAGSICEDCVGSTLKLAGIRHRCYHESAAGSAALTASLVGHRMAGTFKRHVDRFITLTPFAKQLMVRDGIDAAQIEVKANLVPDRGTPLAEVDREPYAVFVGRLVEEKGIETLLSAWRSVRSGLDLVVIGNGPLEDRVQAAARENPAIRVRGWLSPDEVHEVQRRAALTIVPSEWYEAGPPLVLLESLSAGTPVVASSLENISSTLLEAQAGRTFTTGDGKALATTVDEMTVDGRWTPTTAQMAQHARRLYLRDHTEKATLSALERIYGAALAHRHSQRGGG